MSKLASGLSFGCAVASCALAIAACGSSGKPKTSTIGYAQALKFSNCMRAHGVSSFPDPSPGGGLKFRLQSGVNPQSPSFQSAQKACSKYAPGSGSVPRMSASQRRRALKFAQCVRQHGAPNFPDPSLSVQPGTPVIALRGMFFPSRNGVRPARAGVQAGGSRVRVQGAVTFRRRGLVAASVGVGCALAIAACGSAKPHAASFGAALKFSNCMRAHGVPNFPDPSSGGNLELNRSGINPQSPSFKAAQTACAKFQPGGPGLPKTSESLKRRALKFAECMRTHGESNFPDPSLTAPKGAASVLVLRGMVPAFQQPFDAQSPAFKQAVAACGVKRP